MKIEPSDAGPTKQKAGSGGACKDDASHKDCLG